MTTHPTTPPSTDRVVAYLAPFTDHLFCAPCGESDRSTALTSDDLPNGGLCVGCGVDVLIPQEAAPPGPDNPRLALLRALNTPPYDLAAGKTSTPLNEAVQLIDAHEAAVLRKAALRLYTALFPAVYSDSGQKAAEGVNRTVIELRRMAAEKAAPARLPNATEATDV